MARKYPGRTRRKRKQKQAGLPPGTVVYTGEDREEPAGLHYLRYTPDEVFEEGVAVEQLADMRERDGVQWLRVEGIHDVETLQRVGDAFDLHALTLEDITNTAHRPKLEEFEQYLLVILHHFREGDDGLLDEENIALVLTQRMVLSFSVGTQEIFRPNRERIGAANGRFRARGADYLLYTLIDSVVDHYVLLLEAMDDSVAELEDAVLSGATRDTVAELHTQRRRLMQLRRAVLPLRDMVIQLQREETEMIGSDITMFLHDVQDHLNQVLDMIESDRETVAGLIELYMTHESNRMNEVMKVLTIIATVFIPLTFIAGVYGMNFDYMPELRFAWGYPAALAVMLLVAIAMFIFFRRRRWM
ncbi:MAG: magnesium/cobalt transporter CorA [Bacteroidota bacterium]|nr:magnesium/cobalt transporter CorA [Bacteroidota bacterium]